MVEIPLSCSYHSQCLGGHNETASRGRGQMASPLAPLKGHAMLAYLLRQRPGGPVKHSVGAELGGRRAPRDGPAELPRALPISEAIAGFSRVYAATVLDYVRSLPEDALDLVVHALSRSEEHTSELQSRVDLVCRLLLEKKKKKKEHD